VTTGSIHVLLLEDSSDDAFLIVAGLRRSGLDITYERVETADAAAAALRGRSPDVVISDYNMPGFGAADGLQLLRDSGLDVPFILVSGQVGEEAAAALMRAGAHDFVLKDRLTRLAPAIQRELREAADRQRGREAETALRTSERRFRLIAEHAQDVIFRYRHGPPAELDYISPAVTGITGYDPDELYRRPELIFAMVEVEDRDRFELSWHAPTPEPLVIRWRRRDGRPVWIEQRAVAVAEDGVTATEGILRDVTERVVAEQEQIRLERQLRHAERLEALGLLAGGIAHDFNNLLAVIMGRADLALLELPTESPHRSGIEGIAEAAQRGAALTRQLLIFSRLEPARLETLDLNAVVTGTEQLLRRTIGEDIEFDTLLEPGPHPVTVDRGRLEQIILNLVVNARAAMPDGGRLTISTTTVGVPRTPGPDPAPHGPQILLSVTDTGTGMEPEVADRVFEPFFTTKGPGQGTGLGLATVHGAVQDAGGHIELHTQPGKGTTFRIHLPLADLDAIRAPDAPAPVPPGNGETVLVVEDDAAVREVIRLILGRSGYHLIEASSPDDALELCLARSTSIDLVLTDAIMPGMSGPQLIERLRRIRPDLPTVLMSGHLALPDGHTVPADTPLIRKPFSTAELLRHLREVLDR
jgi:two-component system cell cycle sensor histidine kinase/response regulator CckA